MKKALLLIIFVLINLLVSCIYPCGSGEQVYFDWDGVSVFVRSKNSNEVISGGKFDAVRFQFIIQQKIISWQYQPTQGELLACDPAGPLTKVRVTDLVITSNTIYRAVDMDYPAFSNLVDVFQHKTFDGNATVIKQETLLMETFDFHVKVKPKESQLHEFTFTFTLEDGRVYSTSAKVTVEP